ncbi:MAG: leucyl/phenylalanyl-tRNA--protein transferase [Zoogloeaceae bacterium]|jgi:leucyl/phenylalanyl-tRNA--protein transferase|nr:leucyl/phenylalanyl-tRNA--protein transferase [Zoogloeaceae bacterium]
MIPWLGARDPFPPVSAAQPDGLLAASGDLTPSRVLDAYRQGIFPWFSEGDPVLWWSPDPRAVLFPAEFRLSRSLEKTLRRGKFCVRLDTAFARVTDACASTPRPGQNGTWITSDVKAAYGALHEAGWAHSVETWRADAEGETLVGGLYGLAIGRVFYGESMFAHCADASKIAFAHLIRYLRQGGFGLLDCQVRTRHLFSLGAREIPRAEFVAHLSRLTANAAPRPWPQDGAAYAWEGVEPE